MRIGHRRIILLIVMFYLAIPTAGCWDRKEIENRGYVLGVGIDHAPTAEPKGQYDLSYAPQAVGQRKYRVTFELPKFRKAEVSKEISIGQAHLIWNGEGESMFAITRMISSKTYFGMFFEDIQIIIFSQAVAQEGIGDILDFFLRDAEMRRRLSLFVTPGRAEDILGAKLQVEEVNSVFIAKLTRSVDKSPYFASRAEIGKVAQAMRGKHAFAIPMVTVEGQEVKLAKTAVFDKNGRMVGELSELETVGAKILRNNLKQGIVVFPNPADHTKIAAFELYEPSIRVNAVLDADNQLRFALQARFIGTLGENQVAAQDALDVAFVTRAEQAVAEEYASLVRAAYAKLQGLKADINEMGGLVHRQHPEYWKQVKHRWDEEVFPAVPLDVSIKVVIRRPVAMR